MRTTKSVTNKLFLFLILLVAMSVPISAVYQESIKSSSVVNGTVTVTVTSSPKVVVLDGINASNLNIALYSYNWTGVKEMVWMNQSGRRWCGFYWFSGVVFINLKEGCSQDWQIDYIIRHELKHNYFWYNLNLSTRISYCNSLNLSYSKDCWESFTSDLTYITTEERKLGMGRFN